MSAVRRIVELTDDTNRTLRVEAPHNSKFMGVMVVYPGDTARSMTLSPAAQLELWRFLNVNRRPVEEEKDPEAKD